MCINSNENNPSDDNPIANILGKLFASIFVGTIAGAISGGNEQVMSIAMKGVFESDLEKKKINYSDLTTPVTEEQYQDYLEAAKRG